MGETFVATPHAYALKQRSRRLDIVLVSDRPVPASFLSDSQNFGGRNESIANLALREGIHIAVARFHPPTSVEGHGLWAAEVYHEAFDSGRTPGVAALGGPVGVFDARRYEAAAVAGRFYTTKLNGVERQAFQYLDGPLTWSFDFTVDIGDGPSGAAQRRDEGEFAVSMGVPGVRYRLSASFKPGSRRASMYSDSRLWIVSAPPELAGCTHLETVSADRVSIADPYMTLHLARSAVVYVAGLWPNRVPEWLMGWRAHGEDKGLHVVTNDENLDVLIFRVHSRTFGAGDVPLGPPRAVQDPDPFGYMYSVFVCQR